MLNKSPDRSLIDRVDTMRVTNWHWCLVAICMAGIMIENFDQIVIAFAMPVIAHAWNLKPFMIGVLLSGSSLGLLLGAFTFGILTDIIGRKKTFLITTIAYSIFVGLSAFSQNFTQLYFLRILAGFGLGGFIPVASAYVSEFSPAKVRGRFMGIFTIGNGFGYILAVVVSMILVTTMSNGWRWAFAFGAVSLLLIPAVIAIIPESVRWLLGKGKKEQALGTIESIEKRALGEITVPHDVAMGSIEQAAAELAQQVDSPKINKGIKVLFTKDVIKSVILTIILWFVLGYTFFGFIQWMPMFLTKSMGYTLTAGYTFALISGIVGTGTPGLTCGFSSDYIGRRLTLTICMIIYAIAGFVFLKFGGWWMLPLYWFSSAMTSQLYIYTPELFPSRIRGTGIGFASSIGSLGGFLAPMLIGKLVELHGLTGVIYVNAILLTIGAIMVWILGVEKTSQF
jgi:putative MFS transporter